MRGQLTIKKMDENIENNSEESQEEEITGTIGQTSEAWNPFIEPEHIPEDSDAEAVIDQPEIVETRKTHPKHTSHKLVDASNARIHHKNHKKNTPPPFCRIASRFFTRITRKHTP